MTKLKFVVYAPKFQMNVGGSIALYNLARLINQNNYSCKIFDFSECRIENNIFNSYTTKVDIDDRTIVIYPEIIEGNPLDAEIVIRWILCELGVNCSKDIYKTWNKKDLVYYFSSYNPNENIENYKILSPYYLNPELVNLNQPRDGYCHIIRKGEKFHENINYIHPPGSLFLDDNLSQENLIFILNRKEYFVSYDPYSYITFMAALCGCISIVLPIEGFTKKEWYQSLSMSKFLSQSEGTETELKGIAYGLEEIEYAKNTLEGAIIQQQQIFACGEKTVQSFLNDIVSLNGSIQKKSHYLLKDIKQYTVENTFPEYSNSDRIIYMTNKTSQLAKQHLPELFENVKTLFFVFSRLINLKFKSIFYFLIDNFYHR